MGAFSIVIGASFTNRGSLKPHSLASRRKSFQYNAPKFDNVIDSASTVEKENLEIVRRKLEEKEVRKEGRKQGRSEGRKERRKEGSKEGRK